MSRYLVTGGAGFIGSHLCDALIARGDSVRVLDDLSTGHRANLPAGCRIDRGRHRRSGDGVCGRPKAIDGCFHLAAIASVERGIKDWLGTHRANLTGAITIFDAIRRHGTKVPVVYASSAAVYGDCQTIPIQETAERRPLSAYGADKYGCELHAITATHVHGIPTVGLRFFNIYGPRQDPKSPYSGVISIFCERIRNGATNPDLWRRRANPRLRSCQRCRRGAAGRHEASPRNSLGLQCLYRSGDVDRRTGADHRRTGRKQTIERDAHAGARWRNPAFSGRPIGDAPRTGPGRDGHVARRPQNRARASRCATLGLAGHVLKAILIALACRPLAFCGWCSLGCRDRDGTDAGLRRWLWIGLVGLTLLSLPLVSELC